jgi:hypothetical protein
VEEAQQRHVLAPVQRVAHEQHPLPTQHLQHHRRVEAAPRFFEFTWFQFRRKLPEFESNCLPYNYNAVDWHTQK